MNKQTNNNVKINITNSFGAIGYLSVSLLWFWTVLLYFSLLEKFVIYLTPSEKQSVISPTPVVAVNSNVFYYIVGGLVVAAVIALTLYMFYKIPTAIVKTAKKMVHESAEATSDFVVNVQHKKETKKFKLQLTSQMVALLKALLIAIPIILTYTSQFQVRPYFDFFVAIYVCVSLAGFSLLMFISQYMTARLLNIKYDELW